MNTIIILEQFINFCYAEKGHSPLTISSYSSDIKHFFNFLENNKIDIKKITKKQLQGYLGEMINNELKRSSFLRKLSSLNKLFEFMISENMVSYNPVSAIKKPKKEERMPKFLSSQEIEELSNTAIKNKKDKIALIVNMLYDSGMRVSELVNITMQDIENMISNGEKIKIYMLKINGKGRKERMVPLKQQTIKLLKKYLEKRKKMKESFDNKYLFCSRGKTKHITREQIGLYLKYLASLTTIHRDRISPHVLRHSFATNLCKNNVNLRIIQELLGHEDISTTEIYINTLHEEIADFVNENSPILNKK